MAVNFAALEARASRAVATHLANAEMVFAAGDPVAVVFERAEAGMPNAFGGPRNLREWLASAPADDFMAAAPDVGTTASINGVNYQVTQIDTDPANWMTLTLRRVA